MALKIILLPFSLLYALASSVRNFLFDTGLLPVRKEKVTVISVGNITTGGTGKTPFVVFIAEYLISKGRTPAVISRGYGRGSDDFVIVCDGQSIMANPDEAGDEPVEISEALLESGRQNFVVAVCADRSRAIDEVTAGYPVDTVILDDAFQHRYVSRNLDVVLINAYEYLNDAWSHRFTLPSGNLREPAKGLQRADIIVQNNKGCDLPDIPQLKKRGSFLPVTEYKTQYFVDSENAILTKIPEPAILVSGLADNGSFFELARKSGVKIIDAVAFEDHRNYSGDDAERILEKYSGSEAIVTTRKDFVKLRKILPGKKLYYMKISLDVVRQKENLLRKIDSLFL